MSVGLQGISSDAHVIPSLFDDPRQVCLDRSADGVNDRWGRGTVVAAIQAKIMLDHGRIPFGQPTELR